MTSKSKQSILLAVVLLIVMGYMTIVAFTQFNPRAARVPKLAGTTVCILLIWDIASQYRKSKKYTPEQLEQMRNRRKEKFKLPTDGEALSALTEQKTENKDAEDTTVALAHPKTERAKLWQTLMWLAFVFLGFRYVGYVYTTPVFLFLYLKFQIKESWKKSFALSVSFGVVVYFVFYYFMRLRA